MQKFLFVSNHEQVIAHQALQAHEQHPHPTHNRSKFLFVSNHEQAGSEIHTRSLDESRIFYHPPTSPFLLTGGLWYPRELPGPNGPGKLGVGGRAFCAF